MSCFPNQIKCKKRITPVLVHRQKYEKKYVKESKEMKGGRHFLYMCMQAGVCLMEELNSKEDGEEKRKSQ